MDIRNKHRLLLPFILTMFGCAPAFETNRDWDARKGDGFLEERFVPGKTMVDGTLMSRFRAFSLKNDLMILKFADEPLRADVAIGPFSDITEFQGRIPNLLLFVGSVVEWLTPAFDAQGAS